jgi:hypothetical protein
MTEVQYTYTVLRYVHDVVTGEFVNVGLLMHIARQGRVLARTRTTIGRIRCMFPDVDQNAFSSSMEAVKRSIAMVTKRSTGLSPDLDAASFARLVVPMDDSSLQWAPQGAGLSSNIAETFERLYSRYIARYDTHLYGIENVTTTRQEAQPQPVNITGAGVAHVASNLGAFIFGANSTVEALQTMPGARQVTTALFPDASMEFEWLRQQELANPELPAGLMIAPQQYRSAVGRADPQAWWLPIRGRPGPET